MDEKLRMMVSDVGSALPQVRVSVVSLADSPVDMVRASGVALVDGVQRPYGGAAHLRPGVDPIMATRKLIDSLMAWRERVEAERVWPGTSWTDEDGAQVVEPPVPFETVEWTP